MKIKVLIQIFLIVSVSFVYSSSFTSAQEEQQVCCQETVNGDFCTYTSSDNCKPGSLQAPTSCSFTSFCNPGTCIDEDSGFCYPNMGQSQCEGSFENSRFVSGTNLESIPECKTGCCIIGTQAQMLTKNRCASEAEEFGLSPEFREDITDEQSCLDLSRSSVKGCCVSEEGNPVYTTKANCDVPTIPDKQGFYEGKFCSDLSFTNPICTKNARTGCLADEDHVYWFDSCGNPENIKESCDYIDGTLCGDLDGDTEFKCESLQCSDGDTRLSINTEDYEGTGEVVKGEVRHGESWCIYDVPDQDDDTSGGHDPPGSRYYRSVCISGQELTEPCADFRKEWCVDGVMKLTDGSDFSAARCVENRGQSCIDQCNTANPFTMDAAQYKEALERDASCCTDVSKRDCSWFGVKDDSENLVSGKCVPKSPLGFKFWEDEGSNVCSKASLSCKAVFVCGGWNSLMGTCEVDEKTSALIPALIAGALGVVATGGVAGVAAFIVIYWSASGIAGDTFSYTGDGWHIMEKSGNCLTQDFLQAANNLCRSYGDCGADYNYLATKLETDVWSGAGFDNTKSINNEIAEALSSEIKDKDWKLGSVGISHDEINKDGKTKYRIPGKFKGPPDWNKGTKFIDQRLKKPEVPDGFERFYTARDGEFDWTGPLMIQLYFTVLSGVAGAVAGHGAAGVFGSVSGTPYGMLIGILVEVAKGVAGTASGGIFSGTTSTFIRGPAEEAAHAAPATPAPAEETAEHAAEKTTGLADTINTVGWIYLIYQVGNVLLEEVKEENINSICKPWQPPAGTDSCELCNPESNKENIGEFQKCSEYRCRSLGASCELINKGTEEEKCVSLNQEDITPPVIKPSKNSYEIEEKSNGMIIKDTLPLYKKIILNLETDEPAQCKMSLGHTNSFEEMDAYFGSNSFKYAHTQNIVFPQIKNSSLKEAFTISGSGDYQLFVRCSDARGNSNVEEYAVRFTVEEGPDLTAPVIEAVSFGEETEDAANAYLTYGTDTIPQLVIFTNEPSECRWSTMDEPFNAMEQNENNVCSADTMNSLGLYECRFQEAQSPGSGDAISGTELNPGETKFLYFKCVDKEDNFNKDPFKLTLHGSQQLNITSIEPGGELFSQAGTQNVTLVLNTEGGAELNGKSECRYSVDRESEINSMIPFTETNSNTHVQLFTSLSSGEHIFYVACHDLAGNVAEAQTQIFLSADQGVPNIIRAYQDTTTSPSLFTVESDEAAECRVSVDGPFENFEEGNLMVLENERHQAPFNSRIYWIKCKDQFGNTGPNTRISFLE